MRIPLVLGVIFLLVGVITISKVPYIVDIIPSIITNNINYIIIGGIILSLYGLIGFIGLVAGIIISLLILIGGFVA